MSFGVMVYLVATQHLSREPLGPHMASQTQSEVADETLRPLQDSLAD